MEILGGEEDCIENGEDRRFVEDTEKHDREKPSVEPVELDNNTMIEVRQHAEYGNIDREIEKDVREITPSVTRKVKLEKAKSCVVRKGRCQKHDLEARKKVITLQKVG